MLSTFLDSNSIEMGHYGQMAKRDRGRSAEYWVL